MFQKYKNFVRGVAVNKVGKTGVVITTTVFITFLIFEFAHTVGLIRNAYVGLITYLAFPVLFIIGLILIPIGWQKYKKQTGKSTGELLSTQFDSTDIETKFFGARLLRTIAILTVVNIIILSTGSIRMLHFMDSSHFCGTACHAVMNPEWVTYQKSPHARVNCVECHVGEGVDALVASKLNGVRQMYLAALGLYNRPIPTPVHTLRPARETCEHCHWPEKFYGQRLETHTSYLMDSLSTPVYTTLNVKIDAGGSGHQKGAHWHVNPLNKVSYTSVDDKRLRMATVTAFQADGSQKKFKNNKLAGFEKAGEEERVMDCVDCHNRATHIYKGAEEIIDDYLSTGIFDRDIPFIKKEALVALTNSYSSQNAAEQGIANQIYNFYKRQYPDIAISKSSQLDTIVQALQEAYATYRHHHMKIEWGTYQSHIGHKKELGCFRCHNANMISETGEMIAHDCTLCHSILALESKEPYQYLEEAEPNAPDKKMHEYLRSEFFQTKY